MQASYDFLFFASIALRTRGSSKTSTKWSFWELLEEIAINVSSTSFMNIKNSAG